MLEGAELESWRRDVVLEEGGERGEVVRVSGRTRMGRRWVGCILIS